TFPPARSTSSVEAKQSPDSPDTTAPTRNASIAQREHNEPKRADHDAPPGEQRKAVALHIAEERLHHDPGCHKRDHEADRDKEPVVEAHLATALVEVVHEG